MLGALDRKEKVVFLRVFPYSLIGKAKAWYLDQPTSTVTDWYVLEEKFLNKFFLHNKFMEDNTIILVFSQNVAYHSMNLGRGTSAF